MNDETIVYIGIGNSDDKLSQRQWCEFVDSVEVLLDEMPKHGAWFSRPDAAWQNACWCVVISKNSPVFIANLKRHLQELAAEYHQDSISWAETVAEFIGAKS